MSNDYFRVMFICMLLAVVLLACLHVSVDQPWLTLGVGCLPLVWYHLFYLTPRASKGLSQSAVDSVYYFGFLVTVAALALSAVTIASAGAATNMNRVVLQFGVGLFATGYAVVARMHLSNAVAVLARAPDAILDTYIRRSMEMVDNIETAVVRTAEFSNIVISKTTEVTENARLRAERSMLDVAKVFEQEMKSTLALARDGITEVHGLLIDASFAAEREELQRSVKATVRASTQLNSALETTTLRMDEAFSGLASTANAAGALVTGLEVAARAIPTLTQKTDTLATEMERMIEVARKLVEELAAVPDRAAMIRGVSADVSNALAGIVDGVKTAAAHAEGLRANTADSSRIIEGAQRLFAGAAGFQAALDPIRGLLDSFADSIRASQQSLAASASGIQASIAASADALRADVERSGDAASMLTERLTSLAQFIIEQTRRRQGVAP